MEAAPGHLLAPPFGLPEDLEARLLRHLREDDWASALVLLREVVTPQTTEPRWLLLLATVRFRDAAEVMLDELADASREALQLIDRALALGAPLAPVEPLREAAERALDEASRAELRLTARLPADGRLQGLDDAVLEALAFHAWRAAPAEAARRFEALAARREGPAAALARTRAALCLIDAGRFEAARPGLEAALLADWTQPPLASSRALLEAVETALLARATGPRFEALWRGAEARGREVGLPFPSIWPQQERLLARCLELEDRPRARALARQLEERPELSAAHAALVRRALHPSEPGAGPEVKSVQGGRPR